MNEKTYRVLIAKAGLDGHDRGAKVVAKALRDAGFEVIYTGLHNRPEHIAAAAIQEDVSLIGLSILSGAHKKMCKKLLELLKESDISQIPLFLGGIIPDDDIPELKEMGVAEVFGPGTPIATIIEAVRNYCQKNCCEDVR